MGVDEDDAYDDASGSGCGGEPSLRSRLASRIAGLLGWVGGGQGGGPQRFEARGRREGGAASGHWSSTAEGGQHLWATLVDRLVKNTLQSAVSDRRRGATSVIAPLPPPTRTRKIMQGDDHHCGKMNGWQ